MTYCQVLVISVRSADCWFSIIIISTLFFYFLLFLLIFSLYSIYITNISIAPSISDDLTADKKLNNFLIPLAETAEQFENCSISEILHSLSNFEPFSLKTYLEQFRNLDLNKYWHPLALFQLFFDWKMMSIIIKETNSFAFHNNSAQNLWVSLSIKELYYFFGCLLLLSLHKQSPWAYSWRLNEVLFRTPLSKNRFKQIIKNFHFKDRGLNLIKKDFNWWNKLESIFSILREKSAYYWLPSTNLTVNKVMLKFEERTSQKITISCKSILTGFKLFALDDSDYIYNWECTWPGIAEGILRERKKISISILNSSISTSLNPTQSVIIQLANSLSKFVKDELFFHFYLDNLFVCWKSAQTLKERGIAVTETVWKKATDYSPRLLQFKKMNRALEWGALQASVIERIACWLWQDANAVMSTFIFYSSLFLFFPPLFSFLKFWKIFS